MVVSDPEAQASSVSIVAQAAARDAAHGRRLPPLDDARTRARHGRARASRKLRAGRTRRSCARRPAARRSGRDVESFTVSARVNDGAIEKGLTALSEEIARIRQFGFGEAELDRAKRDTVATYERAYNERDKAQSGGHASELLRHFLNDEAVPGIDAELAAAAPLPADDHRRRGQRARARVPRRNQPRHPGVVAGESRVSPPSPRRAWRPRCAPAARRPLTAWKDETAGRELMAKTPAPGSVTLAPRDSRARRHGADALERRRGVAQADRFPERPGAVSRLRARRRVARPAGRVPERVAEHRARRGRRRRRFHADRPGQGAGRADRQRVAVHRQLHARDLGRQHPARPRGRAAARLPLLHGAEPRSRRRSI